MKKWIHWFKTGEGGDERVRGINARSGLLSFFLLILLLAIRSVLVRIGFEELSSPDVDVYIIIFISAFFILINALLGASLKDEIREMKNPIALLRDYYLNGWDHCCSRSLLHNSALRIRTILLVHHCPGLFSGLRWGLSIRFSHPFHRRSDRPGQK
jgi:hypothetical protein